MTLPRFGGTVVYEERRDSGGMFQAMLGVEQVGDEFIPWVVDWHGGLRAPAKETLDEAKGELTRLFNKKYGWEE